MADAGHDVRIVATRVPGPAGREDRAGATVYAWTTTRCRHGLCARVLRRAERRRRRRGPSHARVGRAVGLRARLAARRPRVHLRLVLAAVYARRASGGAERAGRRSGSPTTSRRCRWRCARGSGWAAACSTTATSSSWRARWRVARGAAGRASSAADRPGRRRDHRQRLDRRRARPSATASPSPRSSSNAPDAPDATAASRSTCGTNCTCRRRADRPLPRRDLQHRGLEQLIESRGRASGPRRGDARPEHPRLSHRARAPGGRARASPNACGSSRRSHPRTSTATRSAPTSASPHPGHVPQLPLRAAEQALRLSPRRPADRRERLPGDARADRALRRRCHLRPGQPRSVAEAIDRVAADPGCAQRPCRRTGLHVGHEREKLITIVQRLSGGQ